MQVNSRIVAVARCVLHCILPIVVLIMVCPIFFCCWASCQVLSFFAATRDLFLQLDVFWWSFYQRLVLFFAENWSETDIYLYGDVSTESSQDPRRESVVFICNHQCSFDWIIADILAVRHGCLGNLRYVLKNSLRFIPLFGYFFKLHGCAYVRRGEHNENLYRQQLSDLTKRGIYWLVIFPEGTRFRVHNKKALDANRQYAEKYNLPTFDLVLTPKHRGFFHAMQCLGSSVDAIYDITIAYEPPHWKPDGNQPKIPSMASYLMGATRRLHIHLKRIPASQVPKEEKQFVTWLCDRFQVKNDILKKFYSTGGALVGNELPPPSRLSPARETMPHMFAALGLTLLLLTTEFGRPIYYVMTVFGVFFTVGWMAFVPDRLSMA